jgi:adenine-specific DNA-methyltransferase
VDFDTTKNLFIEGDNLDALKLLQETYLGKVKVIFIDPPYNTGNDFIYRDNFSESSGSFFLRSNQRDEEGNRLVVNTDANGRFHSDWLSMIYPRLKLSWNLLAEDGIIAVTINDKEIFQLGKVMDEIFGASSQLACAPWLSEASGGKEKTGLRTGHEFILLYFKRTSDLISREDRSVGDLNLHDEIGPYRKGRELMKWGGNSLRRDRPNQFYELPTPGGNQVLPYRNDGMEGHWRWGKDNSEIKKAMLDPSVFHWELRPFDDGVSVEGKTERWVPYEKIRDEIRSVGWSTWLDKVGTNADATRELKDLFGFKPFDTPKPTSLIRWVLNLQSDEAGIVLDFFAGSAATAQAVLDLNTKDRGTRRFILVQLDETLDPDSAAYKAGFRTVADIGKERIRLVGSKIRSQPTLTAANLDMGFRVMKIDTSNMREVYYTPDSVQQADLLAQVDNIRPDRTPEDLLFQVLVDQGVDFALPIAEETINGKKVFFVDNNALAACFDSGITDELVKEIAKRKPLRAVFRDASYGSDSVKINVDQIFRLLSPETEVRSI